MDYPGLICDALRPMYGAAAPARTAEMIATITGLPFEPSEER